MSAEHVLRRAAWVPTSAGDTFELFSDAFRLELITPPWLAFRVITPAPLEMAPGTRIDYRLRLHGLPIRWRTRIEVWEPPRRFVDVQLSGPYRLWHHTHAFEPHDGGTLIFDRVRYSLPLGSLGELAHRAFVRRDLERIFDYRQRAVASMLTGRERPDAMACSPRESAPAR